MQKLVHVKDRERDGQFQEFDDEKLLHLLDKNSAQTEKQPVISNCALNWSEKDLLLVRVAGILK